MDNLFDIDFIVRLIRGWQDYELRFKGKINVSHGVETETLPRGWNHNVVCDGSFSYERRFYSDVCANSPNGTYTTTVRVELSGPHDTVVVYAQEKEGGKEVRIVSGPVQVILLWPVFRRRYSAESEEARFLKACGVVP